MKSSKPIRFSLTRIGALFALGAVLAVAIGSIPLSAQGGDSAIEQVLQILRDVEQNPPQHSLRSGGEAEPPGKIPTAGDFGRIVREDHAPKMILRGTSAGDSLFGRGGNDIIFGFGGPDRLAGNLGNDILVGGDGNDFIIGNNGVDFLYGENGNDNLDGSNGGDFIHGGYGDDEIQALAANDYVNCGPGDDNVNAGLGDDDVFGGPGDDFLWLRWGDDSVDGGEGDDTVHAAGGVNELVGGPGNDIFFYDIFDERDNDAVDTILDFKQGEDKIRVNREISGTVKRSRVDGVRRTEFRIVDPTGQNVRDIIVIGVYVRRNDVEIY